MKIWLLCSLKQYFSVTVTHWCIGLGVTYIELFFTAPNVSHLFCSFKMFFFSVLIFLWLVFLSKLFCLFQGIKESVKSSGILGRITPPYVPHRPEVYGVPRLSSRSNSALYSCSDRMRLLNLIGYQLDWMTNENSLDTGVRIWLDVR